MSNRKPFFALALLFALSTPLVTHAQEVPGLAPAPETAAGGDNATTLRETTEAYNAGLAALNKNDLTTAATQFQKAVDLSPGDAGALMFLGYVKLRQEQYSDALTSLEAAKAQIAKLDAKLQPILYNNLGIAYANSNRQGEARAAYQKALDLSKDEYTDARYNLAFALLAQKNYVDAIPHLVKLRDQRLTDRAFQSSIYDGLAEAYESQNNWAQALGAYKKVTEFNTSDPAARFNYALALSKTGRIAEATAQGVDVLKMRPNHQQTLLLLGDLYSRQSKWEEAKGVLTRYVAADPQNFTAWFTLGVAYDYTARFPQALDAYAKAEALSPNDPAVKNNIGRILYKQAEKDPSKFDDAASRLQDALKLDPNFDDARVNLALVYTAQNKWDDAIMQWKVYLDNIRLGLQKPGVDKADLRRKALSARGALAENYLKAGATTPAYYANAVREYRALLVDSPDNLDAMSNLGLALYHTKSYEEAAKTYRQVILKDAKNAIAYNNLGVVLEASGRRGEAIENYRQALKLNPNYAEAKVNIERLTTAT